MMKFWRIIAVLLGTSLIVGELWRSWGVGRPILFVIDDIIMGGALIVSAVMLSSDTLSSRAFYASSWGLCAGMLYGSFFSKVVNPEKTVGGNWDASILTVLIGVAFAVSIAGLISSILVQPSVK